MAGQYQMATGSPAFEDAHHIREMVLRRPDLDRRALAPQAIGEKTRGIARVSWRFGSGSPRTPIGSG